MVLPRYSGGAARAVLAAWPMDEWTRALTAHRNGDMPAAEAGYRRVMAEAPRPGVLHNLADVLERTGRVDEAGAIISSYLAGTPGHPRIRRTMASHLRLTRDLATALRMYEELIEEEPDDPDHRWAYGMTLLGAARLQEAWSHYEHRPERLRVLPWAAKSGIAEWRGEDLTGKRLLIWHEQGLGDQILAARFIPMLGAASVSYGGPMALRRLFQQLGVNFGPVDQRIDAADFDYWTLPLSMPGHLGVTEQLLPVSPYLSGRPTRHGGIGVVWKGDPRQTNDAHRSLSPDLAARLFSLPGAISLDPADTGAADFQDTADIVAGLDLVISVDTSVAHLAAAMGKAVWLPLGRYSRSWPFPWSAPSLWYPTVRAFKQAVPGEWRPVLDEIEAAVPTLHSGERA